MQSSSRRSHSTLTYSSQKPKMITIETVRLSAIKLLHACSQQEIIHSPVKINHLYNPPVLERFSVCIGEINLLKRLVGPVGLYSYTQHAYSINSIPPRPFPSSSFSLFIPTTPFRQTLKTPAEANYFFLFYTQKTFSNNIQ